MFFIDIFVLLFMRKITQEQGLIRASLEFSLRLRRATRSARNIN